MNTVINPFWRQFVCRTCGRIVSETIPAGTDLARTLPTIDYIDSCALCAQKRPH